MTYEHVSKIWGITNKTECLHYIEHVMYKIQLYLYLEEKKNMTKTRTLKQSFYLHTIQCLSIIIITITGSFSIL